MTIWKNCTCDLYFYDARADLKDPGYEVRIDGDEMVISYQDDGEWVNYKGKDLGGGHYELIADDVSRAMMHRVPNSEIIEGFWQEGDNFGMWRLYLKD